MLDPRLALALWLVLGSGCASWHGGLEDLEVNVSNLVPLESESTLFEQRIQVDLRVRNPNDQALEATGVDFLLEVNGAPLARGLGNEPFTVPRLGETVITVVATTTVLDLARQLVALSESQDLTYYLSGRLHLAGPLRRTVSFEREGRPLP